jgi:hypothetical protein
MKYAAVAIILLLVAVAGGDAGGKPSENKFPAAVYYQDPSGHLVPLESQIAHLKREYRAWGFAGGATVYLVEGEKSPVRLMAQPKVEFILRLGDGVDPLETVQFYRFEHVGGSRVKPITTYCTTLRKTIMKQAI